jgi:predicted nucleotidyltransferase
MHRFIDRHRDEISLLCRRYGVARLDLFGSGARALDFDPVTSDADFLVVFAPDARNDLVSFLDFKEGLEALLGRKVDLVEREAVEASRNFIRREHILADAERVYG